MKIAVFTDSFFPAYGGTEKAVYYLTKNLLKLGHQIILFAPDYHREQSFDEFEVVRVRSIKLTQNDMAVLGGDFKKVFKRLKDFEPDIIYYCTASGMATMAVKAARKLQKPVVATVHTKFKEAFYDGCKSRLITAVMINSFAKKLNKTDRVVTVSNDMAHQLESYGCIDQPQVIKNGFDSNKTIGKNNKKIGEEINFMFCGRLIKVKNIQFSLKSLAILKKEKKFDNFKFILVGEGNYRKKLEKLIKKEGLADNVIFTGLVKNSDELDKLYRNSYLFLFPSTFDTDGLVVCEAAEEGTPSLTIEGFGASERITNNENGFISKHDERAFAERIYQIVNDKTLYNHVCENISSLKGKTWFEIAKDYSNLFTQLLQK